MVNDPLLNLSATIFRTAGQRPVSLVYECSAACQFKKNVTSSRNVEREIVQKSFGRTMYCNAHLKMYFLKYNISRRSDNISSHTIV